MKVKRPAAHIADLNTDCLLSILEHLNIKDAYFLEQLSWHLADVVHLHWQHKYSKCFDFAVEGPQLKLLARDDVCSILKYILQYTQELRQLSDEHLQLLTDLLTDLQKSNVEQNFRVEKLTTVESYTTKSSLSLTKLNSLTTLSNLRELHLLQQHQSHHQPIDITALCALLSQLPLRTFNCTAVVQQIQPPQQQQLAESLQNCPTLERLLVNVTIAAAVAQQILKLPKLQQLRVYTNVTGFTYDTAVVTTVTRLVATVRRTKYAQIEAFHLRQSHFKRQYLQQLYQLPNLRQLTWQSFLQVEHCHFDKRHSDTNNDDDDGTNRTCIKWQTYDTQLTNDILQLCAESANLNFCDFQHNCHVTNVFVAALRQLMLQRWGYEWAAKSQAVLLFDNGQAINDRKQKIATDFPPVELGYFEFGFGEVEVNS